MLEKQVNSYAILNFTKFTDIG